MGMVTKLTAVVIYAPIFLLAGILVAAVGGYLGQIYMKAQLPVKREMSNAKAPVLAVLGESITGLSTCLRVSRADPLKLIVRSLYPRIRSGRGVQAGDGEAHRPICSLREDILRSQLVRCMRRNWQICTKAHRGHSWMSVRIDTLSALFTVSLATYLTYRPSTASSSTVGFTLIMASKSDV